MQPDRQTNDEYREVRIEGFGLYVVGALVVAALVGAFYLGRWIERGTAPPGSLRGAEMVGLSEDGRVDPRPADVSETATHFDQATGAEQEAEPQREVQRPGESPVHTATTGTATGPKPATQSPPPPPAGDGRFFVQVAALSDQAAAASIKERLEAGGYSVRMKTERQGQTVIYKVRVGGYGTREEADRTRSRLESEGHKGAWVTQ